MTRHEALFIAAFLRDLSGRYGNDGCGDLYLEVTPENLVLVADAEKMALAPHLPADYKPKIMKNKIATNNSFVLDLLIKKFEAEHGIPETDIPEV